MTYADSGDLPPSAENHPGYLGRLASTSHSVGCSNGANISLLGCSDVFTSVSTEGSHGVQIRCQFSNVAAFVEVVPAPVKTLARMREKVLEYSAEVAAMTAKDNPGHGWPQAARIVDPVRSTIVCNGPAQILEVFQWFSAGSEGFPSKPICRVKNRFSFAKGEVLGGCGDLIGRKAECALSMSRQGESLWVVVGGGVM